MDKCNLNPTLKPESTEFQLKPAKMNAATKLAESYLGDKPTSTSPSYKTRPGETMKALVWMAAQKVEMQDVPVPAVTEPKDIVLRVTGTTVCGSDLHCEMHCLVG